MKNNIVRIFTVLCLLPLVSFGQKQKTEKIRVFYLGGQSNMDGYGYNKDLPKSLNKTIKDVWIFHGNIAADDAQGGGEGIWEELKPGHGKGFSSSAGKNMLTERFGVELSFAVKLKSLYPNEKIAIIKYSRGGTSIDSLAAADFGSWEPDYSGKTGINQYDHFLATVRNAMAIKDIDGNGREDILVPSGIIWMQGESDAIIDEAVANRYYANLKRLMDLIRAAFRTDDLPVVVGKISDSWNNNQGKVWKYGELVQYAQERFVRKDANAAIVKSTRYYKYSDPYHYDSNGYIDLGEKFAEAVFSLEKETSILIE